MKENIESIKRKLGVQAALGRIDNEEKFIQEMLE
jgi:hypothetical protein